MSGQYPESSSYVLRKRNGIRKEPTFQISIRIPVSKKSKLIALANAQGYDSLTSLLLGIMNEKLSSS